MPEGRPSDYTPEIAEAICERLSLGDSLREVCKDDSMPARSTVFRWIGKHPEFSDQYAKAKEAGVEVLADELIDIADNSTNDYMEIASENGECESYKLNGENIQRSKLRVDTRKWVLSKLCAKKYGDSISVGGKKGEPIETKDVSDMPVGDAARRVIFLLQAGLKEQEDKGNDE
jgi:hypothetical protein